MVLTLKRVPRLNTPETSIAWTDKFRTDLEVGTSGLVRCPQH